MMRDFSLWRWFFSVNFIRSAKEEQNKRRSPGKLSQTKVEHL
jgi:hypothetical protein